MIAFIERIWKNLDTQASISKEVVKNVMVAESFTSIPGTYSCMNFYDVK